MDLIDEILLDWHEQRPDIDCSGKETICRLLRTYHFIISELERALKPLGITPNVFSVMVTIRRKGIDAEVPAHKIMQEALVTSGAMTNLLNRLIKSELISKRKAKSGEDTRSVFFKLTQEGLALIDKAMQVQAACEVRLSNALTVTEKQQLSSLLKNVLPEGY